MSGNCMSFLLFLTIITTSISTSHLHKRDAQDDAYWISAVRVLCEEVVREMLITHGSYMAMFDLNEFFGGKLLNGKFIATGGTIGNFSTLNIVNLSVSTTPESFTVSAQVKLGRLEVGYRHFDASVRFLSLNGNFTAALEKNLLSVQVTLNLTDDNCTASLDFLELTEFDGITVNIEAGDTVNKELVNRIAKMVISKITPKMKPITEAKLKELVIPYLSIACEYWSGS